MGTRGRWFVAGMLVVGLLVAGGWQGVRYVRKLEWRARKAEFISASQLNVINWTAGQLTQAEADRDSLAELLKAAKKLHGKLIGGVVIHVPARDTTIIHDSLPTTTVDSTRTAEFRDSTFAGSLHARITAPPCCAPLAVSYEWSRPAFTPAVGFTRVGDSVVALVSWEGEQAQIAAPYFAPQRKPLKWYGAEAQTLYEPVEHDVLLQGGPVIRIRNWHIMALVSQKLAAERPHLWLGLRKEW